MNTKTIKNKPEQDSPFRRFQHVLQWLLVLGVDGGVAAVALARAGVAHQVVRVARVRLDAALYHPPGPQPPGKRGRKPTKGPAPA